MEKSVNSAAVVETTIEQRAIDRKRGVVRLIQIIKSLLGMSRAPVAIFVVAHAGLAAILAKGEMPETRIIIIGIFACLTGTAALISLNDLLDVELDRKRMAYANVDSSLDLGSLFIHHPVAKGVIGMRLGIAWSTVLSLISLYLISLIRADLWPIFIAIAVCVVLYSKLSQVTFLKFLAVAMAVTLGALAGWFAVGGVVNRAFIIFAVWTFVWEIGGRNIPNDFNDIEEDRPLGTKTIPVVFGPERAAQAVFTMLVLTFFLSIAMVGTTGFSVYFKVAVPLLGIYLLLFPGMMLLLDARPEVSVKLYNRSAFYPLVLLAALMMSLYLS